jgi:phage baseplate assembly protein gpV
MRTETGGDWQEALATAMEGKQSEMWTALPAIINSFDASKRTCTAQPSILMQFTREDASTKWDAMPLLVDVPVMFAGGGGYVLTFPLKSGDEGLVVFASRCIDTWWQNGDLGVQAELRMHDLSDGFFIPTVRSLPHVESGISTADADLRAVDPAGPHVKLKADNSVEVTAPALVTVTAPAIVLNGNVTINGNATINGNLVTSITGGGAGAVNLNGVLTINGEQYTLHRHTGVQSGASNTGPKA